MMMMMMKVSELVVVVCSVLCVSAVVVHEDLYINGCSDSDGEVAYTLDGEEKWFADFVNKKGVEPQPPFMIHTSYREGTYEQAVANQQVCRGNLKTCRIGMKDVPDENDAPSTVIIYSRDDLEPGQTNTLICHVSGFYPAPVKVYWTKNGEKATEGTSINVPYVNKDGTFQQISRLEFTPQPGDMYSCSVEHPALETPLTRLWDVQVQQPSVGPAVFCGLGLTIGLLGVAAGTFFLIKGNECR